MFIRKLILINKLIKNFIHLIKINNLNIYKIHFNHFNIKIINNYNLKIKILFYNYKNYKLNKISNNQKYLINKKQINKFKTFLKNNLINYNLKFKNKNKY